MSDENAIESRLLEEWRAGDRAAGDELLRQHTPALQAFLGRKTTRNVEDLVQRTLLACVQAVGTFEGRSSFKTFLLGIARNQFFMSLRSNEGSGREPSTLATWPEESPSQLLAAKQEQEFLSAALAKVAQPFRMVLELFYVDGLSVEEIARTLEISDGTVKSRLARGRSMIRGQFAAVVGDGELI
jgi:RNA polymerase sigma factor (sigma-70 family)